MKKKGIFIDTKKLYVGHIISRDDYLVDFPYCDIYLCHYHSHYSISRRKKLIYKSENEKYCIFNNGNNDVIERTNYFRKLDNYELHSRIGISDNHENFVGYLVTFDEFTKKVFKRTFKNITLYQAVKLIDFYNSIIFEGIIASKDYSVDYGISEEKIKKLERKLTFNR